MSNPLLEEIEVHVIDMDTLIEEHIVLNDDGSYSIFINARYSRERQMLAYRHALEHILRNDFDKDCADDIEKAM